jgi:hypothetical protein
MDWYDVRLSFLNLRGLRALNTLNDDEYASVWKPELYYDNVELDKFEVNVAPAISVVTNSSYTSHLVAMSDLYNAQEFEGASNPLRWSTKARYYMYNNIGIVKLTFIKLNNYNQFNFQINEENHQRSQTQV